MGVYATRGLPDLWWLVVGVVGGLSGGSLAGFALWWLVKDRVDVGLLLAIHEKWMVGWAVLGLVMASLGVYLFFTRREPVGLVAAIFFGSGAICLFRARRRVH